MRSSKALMSCQLAIVSYRYRHKKAGSNVTCPALLGSGNCLCSRSSNREATPYINTPHTRCVYEYTSRHLQLHCLDYTLWIFRIQKSQEQSAINAVNMSFCDRGLRYRSERQKHLQLCGCKGTKNFAHMQIFLRNLREMGENVGIKSRRNGRTTNGEAREGMSGYNPDAIDERQQQ